MKRYETFLDKHCGQPFANIEEDANGGLVMYDEAQAEIDRLAISHRRYETLRTLTPREFTQLTAKNIETGRPFDELVDELMRGTP